MPIKNHLDTSTTQQNILSTPKYIKISATVSFLASILCSTPIFGQTQKNMIKKEKHTTTTQQTSPAKAATTTAYKESLTYDSLKKVPIWKLEKAYGTEKTLEILLVCNIAEINKLRVDKGLCLLTLDTCLTKAAKLYAQEMSKTKNFGHRTNGTSPAQRGMAAGYPNKYISENLLYFDGSIEDAVKNRQHSSGHFATLMDPRVSRFGTSYCNGYWVNMFGMVE